MGPGKPDKREARKTVHLQPPQKNLRARQALEEGWRTCVKEWHEGEVEKGRIQGLATLGLEVVRWRYQ
jgi:hypothetical protein